MKPEEEAHALEALVEMSKSIVEMKEAVLEMRAMVSENLDIAQQYKKVLGDPLKKGVYAIGILRSVLLWVTGTLLTLWGMKELFDHFFVSRIKP